MLCTGSQVCNLSWSKNVNEIVSTHGYSQNQIVVWKYPSMTKLTTLTGHTLRVLYLAVSPDGQTIVTGAGAGPGTGVLGLQRGGTQATRRYGFGTCFLGQNRKGLCTTRWWGPCSERKFAENLV